MGRRADYFQKRIPSQRIGQQLSVDASVVGDEDPNHFLPRTRNRLHRPSSGASARRFESRTGHTSERKNKFAATPDFLEPESGKELCSFRGGLTLTSARMVMAPRVQRGAVY